MQRATVSAISRAAPFGGASRRPVVAVRAATTLADSIRKTVADNKVVVYSKTTCPYCTRVKGLLAELKVPALVIELDQTADGPDVQASMMDVVGRRSVPQVFIGGNHVGGCDDTVAAYEAGKLKDLLGTVGFSI
ncbi:glutaredoxin-C4 [Raphidocelis subcapitata]|uniref:Glutaredoxin-C4 n=1 Tax=Raphidocelis subcapitata TaxID=307507 RepID=A0A2V0P3D3_9CHLO|nr:glutaredoxin-C4 [Raphidocelis subcapitata]|eukprot:GBF91717.1 glutaredoxin-C4 [Raphidocelis subcapitata]